MDEDEEEMTIHRTSNKRAVADDDIDALDNIDANDDSDNEGKRFVRSGARTKETASDGDDGNGEGGAPVSESDPTQGSSTALKKKKNKKRMRKDKKKSKDKKGKKGGDDDDDGDFGGDDDDDDISDEDEGLADDDLDVINGERNESSKTAGRMDEDDDDAFIDRDDDQADLMAEYDAEKQEFESEEEEDDEPKKKKSKYKAAKSEPTDKKRDSEKITKGPGRGKKALSQDERKKIIDALIPLMEDSWRKDKENLKKKEPAFNKLNNLETVMETLNKKELWEELFDAGLIKQIIRWLTPTNNVMTNVKIRTRLIELISRMPIHLEKLRQDNFKGLSNLVAFLQESPEETQENKAILDKMLVKWKMEFLNPLDERNYSQNAFAEELDGDTAAVPKSRRAQRNSSQKVSNDARNFLAVEKKNQRVIGWKNTRASVPAPMSFNFTHVVEKSRALEESGGDQKDQFTADIEKRIEGLGRKTKNAVRAANLSIEGRGI